MMVFGFLGSWKHKLAIVLLSRAISTKIESFWEVSLRARGLIKAYATGSGLSRQARNGARLEAGDKWQEAKTKLFLVQSGAEMESATGRF